MLPDILIIFILSVSGKPDMYSPTVFSPTAINACEDVEQFKQPSLIWAMQAIQRNGLAGHGITPDDVSVKCIELDHIDPDTQPDETGA